MLSITCVMLQCTHVSHMICKLHPSAMDGVEQVKMNPSNEASVNISLQFACK
jgi:hypothetical protein